MENTSAPTPTKALTIAAPEKSWGQQHRLHAARSNAFDRLVNGETDEEIRAALANFEPSRSGLILALAGWQEETRPVCDLDDESLHRLIEEEIGGRSEEHTSELQSLMRNSYAVFCLKKNTHKVKN